MTIKTLAALRESLADNQARAITPADLRDLAESLVSVAGAVYGASTTFPVTTDWQVFTGYTGQILSGGLTFANGIFTVEEGADGVYNVDAVFSLASPGAGLLQAVVFLNGAATPFAAQVDALQAGKFFQLTILGGGQLNAGDRFGIAVKASGNVTLQVASSQLRAERI